MDSRGKYEPVTHIRDPLYGEIHLSQLEADILDTKEVQRLRHIRQLGAVTRVYPSATHTRFSHSLGVMHLAGKMANMAGLSDKKITESRISGLLHDTGHGPFSHTSEQVTTQEMFNHEERSCRIARKVCEDAPVDEQNIVDYISGDADFNVVSGMIDADRLDYIVRDSLFTSVEHGQIDVNSVVRFIRPIDDGIGFDEKAIPSIKNLLSARLRMRRVVYRYGTVRRLTSMIRRAMEEYVRDNSIDDMIEHNDYTMHSELISNNNKFYKMMIRRDLSYHRFEFTLSDITKTEMKKCNKISNKKIRERISSRLGKSEDDIILSPPHTEDGAVDNASIIKNENKKTLEECSDFPGYINEESWRSASFHIYINQPDENIRSDIIESIKSI